ncbi:MAG: phosphatidate cytidylyltransferase [Gemmataceae bacterium]
MLRTRLIVGTILATLAGGMLLIDERFGPWYPFLAATVAFLATAGTVELWRLLPSDRRPSLGVVLPGVVLVIAGNWWPLIRSGIWHSSSLPAMQSLPCVMHAFAAVVLLAFLVEMATFTEPGRSVVRIAIAVWMVAYLGLLPSFLVQLRLSQPLDSDPAVGSVALALAIFVPKGCDIGAYFTGRLLGRHRMTPVLSPKKTWEGAIGGMLTAVAVAYWLDRLWLGPQSIYGCEWMFLPLGLSVGLAGLLGDLAESLVKRDCQQKDASHAVPGFGGILDVVDAVIFAAPVAYWWLGHA